MSARTAKTKPKPQALAEADLSFGGQAPALPDAFAPLAAQAARSALIGVEGLEAALKSWRSLIDASRTMIREQQDMALRLCRAQLADAAGAEQGARAGAEQDLLWPMNTAIKSYEQMTGAVLQAQRGALKAFARPH